MRSVFATLVAAMVAVLAMPAAPAAAQDERPLAISIGDGGTETIAGESVEYRLVVRNDRPEPVALRVQVAFPTGMEPSKVDGSTALAEDSAEWRPTVQPGAEWSTTLSGVVAVDVPFDKRLAVTACGFFDDSALASTCATDMNTTVIAPRGRVWVAWVLVGGLIAAAVIAEIRRAKAAKG
ncbi:hypothetical protein [Phytomonospora endophytica]|uniref:DUF11 domain-containing protein n=1 Tax=Phytomonospora endophytica TaxID=714109 RepID=A0A841FHJ8_9ACTN|nr:hypothetical protein [Phytomonospora endophytica]MBB6036811.1 hypothetical protein [Phytomonospora endophytica]GIG68155.1 hypothetical protein Pen01_44500 [Phytomonospora endophytica]